MVVGNHRRVDAYVDARIGGSRDGEQLDGLAQLLGDFDIRRGDGADALHVDVVGGDARAEAHRSENRDLGGGVEAVDVGRGIGFGVPERLRIGQNLVERGPLMLHA